MQSLEKTRALTNTARFVQTESGNKAAAAFGMKEAATPVTESVEFLVSTVRSFRIRCRRDRVG